MPAKKPTQQPRLAKLPNPVGQLEAVSLEEEVSTPPASPEPLVVVPTTTVTFFFTSNLNSSPPVDKLTLATTDENEFLFPELADVTPGTTNWKFDNLIGLWYVKNTLLWFVPVAQIRCVRWSRD